MSKGWTQERRKAQAERIRQNKPWEKSTGPRTAKGKKASSLNALKHGRHSRQARMFKKEIHRLLFFNREFVKQAGELAITQAAMENFCNEVKKKACKNSKEGGTPSKPE